MEINKLVLIDGNAIIHRAYHAMPALSTPTGQPIGAVQGFINMLLKVIEDMEPSHIAVAWDRPEPTFRNKLFKEYQSQRPEVDKELVSQFDKVRAVLDSFDIVQYDKKGFEADDIIGTLATKSVKHKVQSAKHSDSASEKQETDYRSQTIHEVIIVTGDKDQLQLVDDNKNIKVYLPLKGLSVGQLMDAKAVKEKLGVTPPQVIDLKGFMGDPSDNYPGVYGVGPKTAISLINEFGGYEETYRWLEKEILRLRSAKQNSASSTAKARKDRQDDIPDDEILSDLSNNKVSTNVAKKLLDGKEDGDISYKLARIVTDVDVPFEPEKLDKWSIGNDKTIKLFKSYGFRSLTKRVEDIRDKEVAERQGQLF